MTYINPIKTFTEDYARLVKVQIDNSLRTWKKEDIVLVTNFPYSYGGVNAIVVPDNLFCSHRMRASKINAICHMMNNHMIDDACWFHDFDAYQINKFSEDILGDKDAAFTDYGFNETWNTGSFFFTPRAGDIFELVRTTMNAYRINEEQALHRLTSQNTNNINKRYARLNSTYNLGQKRFGTLVYEKADKPIRVLHFHPKMADVYERVKPFIPPHLLEIFKKHGYS